MCSCASLTPLTQLALLALLPQELDTSGVGELIQLAAQRGRATRPGIQLGICGERQWALPLLALPLHCPCNAPALPLRYRCACAAVRLQPCRLPSSACIICCPALPGPPTHTLLPLCPPLRSVQASTEVIPSRSSLCPG